MPTEIRVLEKPKLNAPVFIEGLPGIGYVGRNAAGYLIEELKAKKFAEIYSNHFPPVVLLDPKKTGLMMPIKNELYYRKAKNKDQKDMIILIGDSQSMDPEGHYVIANKITEFLKKYKVSHIITIGGFGTGQIIEKRMPKVYGAATDEKEIKIFEKHGVKFKDTNIGQIIGASGMIVVEGKKQGIPGVCLMGETSGMLLSDPKATESVLVVIAKYLKIKVDMAKLEQRVKDIEKVIKKIEDLQAKMVSGAKEGSNDEHLGYIG